MPALPTHLIEPIWEQFAALLPSRKVDHPLGCHRRGTVIDFWIAFSEVIVIVGRLIREVWTHYRWEGRPHRRP